ncbi:hypothetical protein CAPTEDRAFT_211501 [Capitella teleta]|uniref:Uncharacterized protein n=1 Tax=Capitella teleta TaxID=283909 RepID=R7UI42_CAPTE|nr:hypothetical protein CAPTEDRAFT_211501 [Capitella teleta]|eukprot:ELU03443.1 hypothetical protein CAPTEDRAFT_211501 [Capitella teleta]
MSGSLLHRSGISSRQKVKAILTTSEQRDPIVHDCTPCRLLCEPGFKTEQECQRLCPDWNKTTAASLPTTTDASTLIPDKQIILEPVPEGSSLIFVLFVILGVLGISLVVYLIVNFIRKHRANQSSSSSETGSHESLKLPTVVSAQSEAHRLMGEMEELPLGMPESSQNENSIMLG